MRYEAKPAGQGRGARGSRGPTVSVVIASTQPRAALDRCLGALVTHCAAVGAEVVVVRGGAAPPAILTRKPASDVKFIPAAPMAGVAELRALGARAASGDIVLFADEESAADSRFVARLQAAAAPAAGHHAGPPSAAHPSSGAERDDAVMAYLLGTPVEAPAAGIADGAEMAATELAAHTR